MSFCGYRGRFFTYFFVQVLEYHEQYRYDEYTQQYAREHTAYRTDTDGVVTQCRGPFGAHHR